MDAGQLGLLDIRLLEGVAELVRVPQVEEPAREDEGRRLEHLLAFGDGESTLNRVGDPLGRLARTPGTDTKNRVHRGTVLEALLDLRPVDAHQVVSENHTQFAVEQLEQLADLGDETGFVDVRGTEAGSDHRRNLVRSVQAKELQLPEGADVIHNFNADRLPGRHLEATALHHELAEDLRTDHDAGVEAEVFLHVLAELVVDLGGDAIDERGEEVHVRFDPLDDFRAVVRRCLDVLDERGLQRLAVLRDVVQRQHRQRASDAAGEGFCHPLLDTRLEVPVDGLRCVVIDPVLDAEVEVVDDIVMRRIQVAVGIGAVVALVGDRHGDDLDAGVGDVIDQLNRVLRSEDRCHHRRQNACLAFLVFTLDEHEAGGPPRAER